MAAMCHHTGPRGIHIGNEKEIVGGKWMVDAVNSMKQACPSSLKVFLRMGCRAMLFDEDKKPPKWEPSELELVNEEMVDEHFIELDYAVVEPLNLPASARSSSPYTSTSHARL
ncbi:hypothetical protein Ancab_002534 [Ancistrocladus abbreviatus]